MNRESKIKKKTGFFEPVFLKQNVTILMIQDPNSLATMILRINHCIPVNDHGRLRQGSSVHGRTCLKCNSCLT